MSLFTPFLLLLILIMTTPEAARADRVVLSAVGDIMLAGSGTQTFSRKGYDYPFAATKYEFQRSDITIGNLEAPLAVSGTEFKEKKFRFRASPKAAASIRNAGISVVSLANNHIMDFGREGLRETLRLLDRQEIRHAGAGENLIEARRPALLDIRGRKVAFLSYSLTQPLEFYAAEGRPGTAPGYSRLFLEDVRQARLHADYVAVSFHWGTERAKSPKAYQIEAAHRAIDAGADLVIGHHPHVLQGIERYRGGIILYSLGNFAFGSMSRQADDSVIARVTLDGGIREVELIPLNVLNSEVRFQPAPLKGKRGREVISRLAGLSKAWDTRIMTVGNRYLVDMGESNLRQARR
jgi:poly-gamma-glutamate synthesis protein (capsule biosynthesis protein)